MSEFGLQDDDKQIILDILKSYPQIEDVILFGSRALNTFKATSDIDLAIKGKDIHTIIAALIADFEESDLIYEVDLVDYASISTEKLREHIDQYGKVFYRKGWVETTLGGVSSSKQYGYTESASVDKVGPKFLRITDIQNDFIDWGVVPYCPISEKNKQKYKLGVGDVVIARTGNSTGATAIIKDDNIDAVFASYLIRFKIDPKKADYNFIDFSLRSKKWVGFVKSVKGGSAQGGANANNFAEYPIQLPPIPEQKAIANILSSFDEKIELLREQNKTLETLSQTIFKEWFVNFNYPGATGEMVDSELGEIPTGWQVKTIDDLIELIIDYRGKPPKKLGLDWSDSGIPALSAKTIKNGKIVRRDAMNIGSKKLYDIWMKDELERKDILLTSEAPLGEMHYLSDDAKYILSQRLFALRTNKEITSEYLYHYLFSPLGQYLLKSRASGSTVEGIRQSELRKIEVILPEKEVMEKASDIFSSVFEKTALNDEQIQNLIKTRDSILPELMSGEVRVQGFIQ